ncbi:MAG: hypothetical protein PWQ41_1692 [Bacillota bacterium]|nr:hypothetical protein [Bacillota bacterium]MDK2854903.1 hypothetical protein [Bacillota bacterium]MDK2925918.1 hypothetical protein [Bacillota bacterium]
MGVRQDDRKWTHIDWELENVTAKMISWFWCNMEKGFALWHPNEHMDFYWAIKPKNNNPIGSIHVAPQRWSDGTLTKPHIRMEDVATLPEDIADIIIYDHAVVVAGISLTEEDYKPDNPPLAYRIHQWEKTDFGVKGMSSAIPLAPEPLEVERGLVWAKHAAEEVRYWQDFLPELYKLWSVVKNPELNPYFSFKIKREGKTLRYATD